MCDLAHAVLLEQFEQDARAETAGGYAEGSIADARQALEDRLHGKPTAPADQVPPDELELRRSLGVA